MLRHSSSTSSSSRREGRRTKALKLLAWTLLWLVGMDVLLGIAFRFPTDPKTQPTELQQYFDYGRSIEGKVRRLISVDDAHAAQIASAGWLATNCSSPVATASPGKLGATVYGMSFSNHVAGQMEQLDSTIQTVIRSGPGASLNHSYACFRMIDEAGGDTNPIQVVGILASTVERMLTLTAMTTSFEAPTPYTYPRYTLAPEGRLTIQGPLVTSTRDLRDPARWVLFKAQLEADDRFYDPLTMDESIADRSVLVRLLRRAYAQHTLSARARELVGGDPNYSSSPEVGPVLETLVTDFAARVRARHQIPVVLLIQDRPGVNALERLLTPALVRQGIPFVSTAGIVRTTDPSNFESDGHFTPAGDRLVAARTLEVIRAELGKAAPAAPASSGASMK